MKKILLPSLVLLLLACSKGPSTEQSGTLKFETITIERSCDGCKDKESCNSISYKYPDIKEASSPQVKDTIQKRIQKYILGESESMEKVMEVFMADCKAAKETEGGAFFDNREVTIIEHNGIIVLTAEMSDYYGGAHPNSSLSYTNLDAKTGDVIDLTDIMDERLYVPLRDKVEKIVREQAGISPTDNMNEAGFMLPEEGFYLNDNFALMPDTVIFFYNQYEIAPYAMGVFEVKLSYKEIGNLISPFGPLARFAALSQDDYIKSVSPAHKLPANIETDNYSFVFEDLDEKTFNDLYGKRIAYKPDTNTQSVVSKVENCYKIAFKNGNTENICDENDQEADAYAFHKFPDYWPDQGILFGQVSYCESSGFMMFELNTGTQTGIFSLPEPSPDKTRFMTGYYDVETGNNANGMQLYSITDGKAVKEFETTPDRWGPEAMGWISNDEVIFKRISPDGYYGESFVAYTRLKIVKKNI